MPDKAKRKRASAGGPYIAPPVQRAVRLIRHVAEGNPVLNMSETAKALKINRTTLLRLLHTLEAEGFVERRPNGAGFQVGLSLLELVLSMFGNGTGLFGVTGLGMITAFAGLALGVFMLILDFDFIEQGIAAGVEERESWRAAFALTVSLVWIYTNLLRILAFFSQE